MLGQVVVGSVRHAPQLTPAEGEQILKVRGGFGIEAQLLRVMIPQPQVLLLDVQGQQPVLAEAAPVVEPLQVRTGLAEELQLHLFKLPDTEDEVAGCDLVPEGLAHLCHAEGDLLPGGTLNIGKVYKDALCGLRPQVQLTLAVLGHSLEGLEHQIELPDVGKILLAAARTGDLLLLDIIHHLLVGPACRIGAVKVLDQIIRPMPGLALLTVHQRVGKAPDVSGCHPGLGIHQNGAVQSHIIPVLLDKLLAPRLLDVVLQLHAQRPVVPCIRQTAVNLAAGIHKAPALAQGNDFVHCLFGVDHK